MKLKILVIGGSYAGIGAIKTLLKLTSTTQATSSNNGVSKIPPVGDHKFEITMIEPKAGFINIMSIPKMVVDKDFSSNTFVDIKNFGIAWDEVLLSDNSGFQVLDTSKKFHTGLEGETIIKNPNVKVKFIQGYVTNLQSNSVSYSRNKLIKKDTPQEFITPVDGPKLAAFDFDYCILASGRGRAWPLDPVASNREELTVEMDQFSTKITNADDITVVGGGAVGVEVAGEIKASHPSKNVTLIHPHPNVPPEPTLSNSYKSSLMEKIKEVGINLRLNTRIRDEVIKNNKTILTTTNGDEITTDLNIWCNYHKNNIKYLENDLFKDSLNQDEITVSDFLQVKTPNQTFEHIFAAGDLPKLGIIKKAGGAMRLASISAANLLAIAYGVEPSKVPLKNWPNKMAITIGSKHSVQSLGNQVIIDNPKVLKNVEDYKNTKCASNLGFETDQFSNK
ncbi:hypothetical protein DASC09_030630 [Saccharomycopsis crataegensis]|uniref:FAD/NAD(P)-binding domain-containing protein n=1 Tax=Saccharomycopsis crataegensis TaxID=43959 RepID=A0AAV5QLS7_9ASCO|nr:hypothetical protein DASC09_030630 [Saccharomycopsis crataegensis]